MADDGSMHEDGRARLAGGAGGRGRRPALSGRRPGIHARLSFERSRWWTRRFLDYIDEMAGTKQLRAGRNCVKSGKVVEMRVLPGLVEAYVQGRRKTPYRVRLHAAVPDRDRVAAIYADLSASAGIAAELLSGNLPEGLADIFERNGVPLTPMGGVAGKLLCSCPEPDDICKHIVAALYVAADAVDRDPFLLLRLRGLEKGELFSRLLSPRGGVPPLCPASIAAEDSTVGDGEAGLPHGGRSFAPVPPLVLDRTFYGRPFPPERTPAPRAGEEPAPAAIFDFPFWRGDVSFRDALAPYYESVRKMLGHK